MKEAVTCSLDIVWTPTLQKKQSFSLRIFSVNKIKSADICGFGHIYWRNSKWKTSFFVQCCKLNFLYFENGIWVYREIYNLILVSTWIDFGNTCSLSINLWNHFVLRQITDQKVKDIYFELESRIKPEDSGCSKMKLSFHDLSSIDVVLVFYCYL